MQGLAISVFLMSGLLYIYGVRLLRPLEESRVGPGKKMVAAVRDGLAASGVLSLYAAFGILVVGSS